MADAPKVLSIERNVQRSAPYGVKFKSAVVTADTGEILIDEALIVLASDPVAYIKAQADALIPDLDWSAVNAS